ncbi:MAG: GIY-YIG nuclease family protein, partial [Nitrososphaera sp.]|nr:GIY-YIG nuclease family protein [Nitrososphaera sp.]
IVYILECADTTLYVGVTNDLDHRVHAHNHAKAGAHYTKTRRPVTLRYSEKFKTKSEALKRETEIKSWPREKKLGLIVSHTYKDPVEDYFCNTINLCHNHHS